MIKCDVFMYGNDKPSFSADALLRRLAVHKVRLRCRAGLSEKSEPLGGDLSFPPCLKNPFT